MESPKGPAPDISQEQDKEEAHGVGRSTDVEATADKGAAIVGVAESTPVCTLSESWAGVFASLLAAPPPDLLATCRVAGEPDLLLRAGAGAGVGGGDPSSMTLTRFSD